MAIICLDAAARKGCCIWGQAEVLASGELFDAIDKVLTRRNLAMKHVVTVALEGMETF